MADNYLITGYWGQPHVTSENDRGIHAGIFGAGRNVLPVGKQFKAEYIGNNTIRMYDGKLMDNGAAAGIPAGEYIDMLISNAGQGMNRNDLIVFQYSLDASTLIERGEFIVVQGLETNGTASDPAITQADLLNGNVTLEQFPLWRVSVSGVAISAPVKLFSVSKTIPDKADSGHSHGLSSGNITGILPLTKGGTGANNAAAARNNLGITPENIGAADSGHSHSLSEGKITGVLPLAKGGTGASDAATARANIGAAESGHGHALTDGKITGTLPVSKGGTGATDAATARTNLGAAESGHGHSLSEDKITGVLPVSKGGTGATNAANALQNLGIIYSAEAPVYQAGAIWLKPVE